ncbi:MAG: peptidase inhibitor I78, partial [Proteobacteria bacterium]|nr:peptidase inhibitor I78 [Pseudomonadota bacterium]
PPISRGGAPAARDSCGASNLQALVGRPRSLIPVPVDPSRQRVACTTCPVAQDVDPGRITFLFDASSGRIQTIKCG